MKDSNDTAGRGSHGENRNEGEGNRTAAREYNRATEKFAASGKVDAKAREAAKAVDGPEGDALRRAEQAGKAHAHGEDPLLGK